MISKLRHHYRMYMAAVFSTNALLKIAELRVLRAGLEERQPDNLALCGCKVYSQNDEDGIIAAIFDRIGGNRTFLEIGLQDGTECNTLHLMMQGWRGGWVEADPEFCQSIRGALGTDSVPGTFKLFQDFARTSNIAALYRDVCTWVGESDLALFSLDIDGNDLHVLEALLKSGASPTVICAEYNGKFPVPMALSVAQDEARGWARDDYFGASLQALSNLLDEFGYGLVTCSLFGANAFFARRGFAGDIRFRTPSELWQPLRLHMTPYPAGHVPSLKYARDVLAHHLETKSAAKDEA
ncbi:MAG: hypothetical protein B7Z33_12165 [Sphingomonadales bacterium 12-68-11]|nr:MAG: hypothetical protein B7Z33_12165 [Sphingomonadales bacterium 12-68-11]